MNTASQDLKYHLGLLQEKLQHSTDYELALTYFLEEFAGDVNFIKQCDTEDAPHLKAILEHIATKALGQPAGLDQFRVFRLAAFRFCHGSAQVGGRVLLFMHFEGLDTGLAALIPGVHGAAEVARFRVSGALAANPNRN